MTAADWAAFAITFGWAATAFWVVHVITRPPDARRSPPSDDPSHPPGEAEGSRP